MNIRKLALLGMFALGLASSGCVSRRIIVFQDNAKAPLTAMEVQKTQNFLFYARITHQFYVCTDTDKVLDCTLACSAPGDDLSCPQATVDGNSVSTNYR
jgi:hypothetical protein